MPRIETIAEWLGHHRFISADELEDRLRRMREDGGRARRDWVDPRPAYIVVGTKPAS